MTLRWRHLINSSGEITVLTVRINKRIDLLVLYTNLSEVFDDCVSSSSMRLTIRHVERQHEHLRVLQITTACHTSLFTHPVYYKCAVLVHMYYRDVFQCMLMI